MELHQMFYIQSQLDKKIAESNEIQGKDLTTEKILALLVELGELANETRSFKFWSVKGPSEREIILEEYVDCLHFILSIGLDKGYVISKVDLLDCHKEINELFCDVFEKTIQFKNELTEETYLDLFETFFALGRKLTFKGDEILQSYLEKNQINHQRQNDGY
ncbi:dUTP diphosphatase [Serpentinicella sp. ANB-PHB4]|uniref:dUTP diphosphatase n=1 Tax=Serpentinicella sp. ANB-PHB4 TaxID=3074076 RepID=UPI00285DED6E|nr:dUTP diphosphatase [Serpentinicella sp. ANB-PHB4]MDR5659160.1 dUTP diphosphatase [Serpentinicella sp. ANB-PHB4]